MTRRIHLFVERKGKICHNRSIVSIGFNKKDSEGFVSRLVAMCGSSNPHVVADFFGVSYNAAKNYLNGRIPEGKVLVGLTEKTPVSIHWLLTGDGDKFVDGADKTEAEMLASILSELADPSLLRKVFEVVSEDRIQASRENESGPLKRRIISIKSERIRKEKETSRKSIHALEKDR